MALPSRVGCRQAAGLRSRPGFPWAPRIAFRRADESAEATDHSHDASNIALVKGMHGNACSNQIGSNRRLKVRKGKNKVRLKCKNLRNIC